MKWPLLVCLVSLGMVSEGSADLAGIDQPHGGRNADPFLVSRDCVAALKSAELWNDERHGQYKLLWHDPIPRERLHQPFTRQTFDAAGWRIRFWNDEMNAAHGRFALAPDGTPAIEASYPAMSDWSKGGVHLETDHFPTGAEAAVYVYDVFLEINPSAHVIDENRSGIISGKLAGLYSDNMNLGRIPNKQKGWVSREVWRGKRGEGVRVGSYDYHLNRTETPDQTTYGVRIGEDREIKPGVWVTIAREVILNDPGQPNGKSRMWVDGHLVADREDLLYRTSEEYPIRGFRFLTFCGGSHPWLVNTDWRIWFRNFQLWVPETEGLSQKLRKME